MPNRGNNIQNLKSYGKSKPPLTRDEAMKIGKKGGEASAKARAGAKTAKGILSILNELPASGNNKDKLAILGIPDEMQTQKTMRIVALHQKALTGDAQAQRLVLEIDGEAPAQTLSLEMGIFDKRKLNDVETTLFGTDKK